MKEICDKKHCTGCSSCFNICPKDAITMQPDEFGFVYPTINQDKCVNCGLCQKTCPVCNPVLQTYPLECYAVVVKDDKELLSCASGGAATQISREIIRRNGIVYGVSSDDPRHIKHIKVDNEENLESLKGSKYVQSEIGNVFKQIKNDLEKSLTVFFVGTPCQVAGLKRFVGEKHSEYLFTADLVCHGVPSQKMLNENIELYKQNSDNGFRINFRKKAATKQNAVNRILFGWLFQNQPYKDSSSVWVSYDKDPYMDGFIGCLTFRNNCYSCRYANAARCGDVTLADFWGLSEDAGFENGKGVSLMLLNSEKGKYMLSLLGDSCKIVKRDIVEAIKGNGQLQVPSNKPYELSKFRELYLEIGLNKAVRKIMKRKHTAERCKKTIKSVIRFCLKPLKLFR